MDRLGVMEVFVLAVETGSFSAVARRLGMGQPTVSRLIAQLEAHLGSRLLLRSTGGWRPPRPERPTICGRERSWPRSTRLMPWCSNAGRA